MHLRYVVDTTGSTAVGSVEVLRSTHQLFADAVKNAMPRQQLRPPRRDGAPTKVTVEELVTFSHPGQAWKSAREPVTRHGVDSTGRLMTRTTYASMVYTPGDPKRPGGWVDPVQIAVDSIVSWAQNTVLLTTRTGQGMASNVNRCEAVRVAGKWTVTSCVTTEHRIS